MPTVYFRDQTWGDGWETYRYVECCSFTGEVVIRRTVDSDHPSIFVDDEKVAAYDGDGFWDMNGCSHHEVIIVSDGAPMPNERYRY